MPYREKIAWLSLIAMAVTFGPYFVVVGTAEPMGMLPYLRLFGIAALAQMLILGFGHLYFRWMSPEEARLPMDERDRAIMFRSITNAYYVLIVGMILVGCVMPFNSSGWSIINAAIFMIVAAEVVHYGLVVVCYRRHT